MDTVVSFLNLLESKTPVREVEDGSWWHLRRNGRFDIRSFYDSLCESSHVAFPWKSIWRTKAPLRVRFFAWMVAWNKILTCDNLIKRGYTMTSWCCMCKCNGETVDHLLIHCPVASFLWCWILSAFGISWVCSGNVADLLFSWWNGLGCHASDLWNLIPLCLMWTIRKERNCRTFEDVSSSDSQLLACFASTLFDWSRVWGFTSSSNITDFISSLSSFHDAVTL